MFVEEPVWPNRSSDFYLNALNDPNLRVRCQAAAALEVLRESRAIAPLIELLANDQEEEMRVNAARALGKLGGDQAVQALIGVLPEPNEKLCLTAARSLAQIGDRQAVPALCAILHQENAYLVIYALRDLGDARAIAPLQQIMHDQSRPENVRNAARWVWANLRELQAQESQNGDV